MNNNDQYYVSIPSLPTLEEYMAEIAPIWESHRLTNNGPILNHFREELEKKLNVDHLALCSNGHMAITLSIRALRLENEEDLAKKNEVITTPFTFASTVEAILENGLKPVFCDINQNDYTIDTSKLEKLIGEHTWAILPVHAYGNVCDIDKIAQIAKKYHLKVIYDAAHAFGALHAGESVAAYGDVTCFSLHATKPIHAIEGGMARFQSVSVQERFERLCNFGINADGLSQDCGWNAKMSEFHAAMGICNLRRFEESIDRRKSLVEEYLKVLEPALKEGMIRANQTYVYYFMCDNTTSIDMSSYAYFPIQVMANDGGITRDQLQKRLLQKGISTRAYFCPAMNQLPWVPEGTPRCTPVAARISKQILCLPMYADLRIEDISYISDNLVRELQCVMNME